MQSLIQLVSSSIPWIDSQD